MDQKQQGVPTGMSADLSLTHGVTAGSYRLAVMGMATHLSIRPEDVVRVIQQLGSLGRAPHHYCWPDTTETHTP